MFAQHSGGPMAVVPGNLVGENGNRCGSALEAVCSDGRYKDKFILLAYFLVQSHCALLLAEGKISEDQLDHCNESQGAKLSGSFASALGFLCGTPFASTPNPIVVRSGVAQDSFPAVRLRLSQGGLRFSGREDELVHKIETPVATATISGTGTLEAFHYVPAVASVFRATDVAMTIAPGNPALAPFTLHPGQIVGVTANEVLPVTASGSRLSLPFVRR
jgi:hypothetical protein